MVSVFCNRQQENSMVVVYGWDSDNGTLTTVFKDEVDECVRNIGLHWGEKVLVVTTGPADDSRSREAYVCSLSSETLSTIRGPIE